MLLAAASAAQRVSQFQAKLDTINQQIATASTPVLVAKRDKLAAELDLATSRRDILQSWLRFSADGGGVQNLLTKIDDVERAVPEAATTPPAVSEGKGDTTTSSTAAGPAASSSFNPESVGVLGLVQEMFAVSHRMSALRQLADLTEELRSQNETLRTPMRADLQASIKQSDVFAQAPDPDSVDQLATQRGQIEALAAHYKLMAGAILPLGEQNTTLEALNANLLQWREARRADYTTIARDLIIRLGGMSTAILIVLIVSKLWRRTTFKYVTDIRRRRQFLMVRRLVVGSIVIIVLIFGIVSQFGSLATFAGLITAGIAVALQTVILSGVAHFFFIGRYGVRVGDRVTISGTTGDVIDIGLFRLYLMELGGSRLDLQPTGRIVVFSNSVLFQPTAFFKQLPGADYSWHEVAMTLSPDTDYQLAETRLLAAVNSVYDEYRAQIEAQFDRVKDALHLPMGPPRPEARLRFNDNGLECVIRYPVEIHLGPQTDDKITRKLLETIDSEPHLRLVASGTPRIQSAGEAA